MSDTGLTSAPLWEKLVRWIIALTGVGMVAFHMASTQWLLASTYELQNIHLLFAFLLVLLPGLLSHSVWARIITGLCVVAAIAATAYVGFSIDHLQMVLGFPETIDVIVGFLLIVLSIEATRRGWGITLPIVSVVFLSYFFLGHLLDGPLYHRQFNVDYVVSYLSIGLTGIYGTFLSISANQIFLFVVFGSMFTVLGIDSLLSELGKLAGRHSRSGPAQMSVVSSSLVGMITGASVANVAVTGAFTIPYMKKRGYSAELAGAIEATSSTGGQIVPPVMGAAAFLMAFFIGIPYVDVMLIGIIPALLFYVGVVASVHFASLSEGINAPTERPDYRVIMNRAPAFLIPLGIIITLLVNNYSPDLAAFWAIIASVIISMARSDRPSIRDLLNCMVNGALIGAKIAVSLAVVGMIAQTLITTGLGSKIAGLIETLSMGNIVLALLLTMVVAIVLGCGVPPAAAYSLVAITAAPAIIRLGLDPLSAHFFAFYFAIMSAVTPPVAMGALAAAALSGGSYLATSIKGFKLAISGFIVPFFIVFNPVARLQIDRLDLAIAAVISMPLSLICLSAAIYGYGLTRLSSLERVAAFASATCAFGFMIFRQFSALPLEYPMFVASIVLATLLVISQLRSRKILSSV
ncbi:MAG: TRAP transporter fused permease subunit [Rhodobacteraceae bacterium]|nr:TRAP transporter fused permease subunit [Paracoccaceae bacterium]